MKLSDCLQQEINITKKRIKLYQRKLKNVPTGSVRVTKNKKSYSFFHCTENSQGKYIREENRHLAAKLCNKEFCLKAEKCDKKVLEQMLKLQSVFEENNISSIWDNMHPAKLKLLDNDIITDSAFAEKWAYSDYEKLQNNVLTYPTLKGDFVRSKSEVMIANFMFEHNIHYRYEQILRLSNSEMFAPDFTIINPHTREVVYWEHFGMMDNAEYVSHTMQKIYEYQSYGLKLGINFFCTFESKEYPFSISMAKDYLLANFVA